MYMYGFCNISKCYLKVPLYYPWVLVSSILNTVLCYMLFLLQLLCCSTGLVFMYLYTQCLHCTSKKNTQFMDRLQGRNVGA